MLARIASTLALGLSLAVLAGCAGKQEAAARRQGEAVPVTAQVVQPMQWNDTLQALGTAKALEIGEVEGAMSSLSIVVAGLLTVVGASIFANLM